MLLSGKWLRALLSLALVVSVAAACNSGRSAAPAAINASQAFGEEKADPHVVALSASAKVEPQLPGMEPALENDALRLYINKTTAEIAVLDRRSGQVWYSNPQGREADGIATPYLKGKLSAQISLVYLMSNGQNKDYDSYNDSVSYGQFEIARTDKDVTVTYRFGNPEKGVESTPSVLSRERFDQLLERLSEPADREELEKRYVLDEQLNRWERREIPKAVVKKFLRLFEKIGYTEEEFAQDNEADGVEAAADTANPKFAVAISYRLDGEHFVASIDTTAIEEQSPQYRIHSVRLLENFGAGGKTDEGYMFLPDGSGALIPLNSGKKAAQAIYIPVYGEDKALYIKEKYNMLQPARFPVFGMKKNEAAFFAIIEHGDALAWLNADISGKQHEFNTVSGSFVILPRDEVTLTQNEAMIKTPVNRYEGKLQIRYAFLSGQQANYSGMAGVYRSYLEQTCGLQKHKDGEDAPFYVEMTGSIPKQENFLGFPYEKLEPLSELKDAANLVEQLNGSGISNVQLKFKGWFNGGLNHDYPSSIDWDRAIGSVNEWKALEAKLRQNGGKLFPDAALLQVYRNSNGFRASKDAAHFISRRYVKIYEFDRAAYFKRYVLNYLLSAGKIDAEVDGFLSDYERYNTGAISLRDLGAVLYSDFKRGNEATRQQLRNIVVAQLDKIAAKSPNVMVDGGNAYALPYASHVLNAPLDSNAFQLAGESVPFYQMVLHGYVEYAGQPYNMSDNQDVRIQILRSLETGSNVYYSWILNDPSVVKDTDFSYLNSNYYKDWLDEATQAYREVNPILNKVSGQSISTHEKIAEDVFRTVYENGLQVIVNYRDEPFTVDGTTISARDYEVKGL